MGQSPTAALCMNDIAKSYGSLRALNSLSLTVNQGEAFCLLGPNGAGKSTAINILLGLIKPDQGRVSIFGRDPTTVLARMKVGAVMQDCDFPMNLTGREIIKLVSMHYPEPFDENELIDVFQLSDIVDRQTGGFSGGQRRRLALALAFCGNAKLVFLDEPTTGLDADARKNFWQFVAHHRRQGGTQIITTHHLDEIESIADRICLINHGQIDLEGSVDEIKKRIGYKKVSFQCEDLPDLALVTNAEQNGATWTLTCPDADALIRQLVMSGVVFKNLTILPLSLEDAVSTLTKSNGEAA